MIAEIFTILTFALVFAIVVGAYLAIVVRTERGEMDRLRARVAAAYRAATPNRASLVREDTPLSEIRGLNDLLSRLAFFVAPLQRLVQRSGVRATVGTVLLSMVVLFAGVFVLAFWYSASPWMSLVLGACAAAIPYAVLKYKKQRLIAKLEEQLPEAMDLIARSLRAGHAFATGLKLAGEEIPDPMGAEFRALHDRHAFGQPMPQALREFAERVEVMDARFFVTAVLTQREAGGNLAEVLDHLSWVVRDRFRIKREVRTKSAHGRMSGVVIAALPPLLFLYTWISSPDRIARFIADPLGAQMIVAALVSQVVGTFVIRKIVQIRY